MKVLHIGFGFRPLRVGGLIEYAEDLMQEQVKRGYDVYYFCAGRHYPVIKRPFVKQWKRCGVTIFEVVNVPIFHGGDMGSFFDLESSEVERIFIRIIDKVRPDVIHIQELAGLPSSLIEIIVMKGIPCVMTLQDYHLLCPTLKLLDFQKTICMDSDPATKCARCIKVNPKQVRSKLIWNTLVYHIREYPCIYKVGRFVKRYIEKIRLAKNSHWNISFNVNQEKCVESANSFVNFFRQRRQVNISRLQKIDLLIAQSRRVEQIYQQLARVEKIRTIHLTVGHIANIKPKIINVGSDAVLKFATINGFATEAKGAYVLLDAVKKLNAMGYGKKFELYVLGGVMPQLKPVLSRLNNLHQIGTFDVKELDQLLNPVHVGIIPSIWEEAFGYVGIEFLAKGIPVIGNARGGIVDYVLPGMTGWLNQRGDSDGLVEIMQSLIVNPSQVEDMNKAILANRSTVIKTMAQHVEEIEIVYHELLSNR